MPRATPNALVIAVDGTSWTALTDPETMNLEDIYPLIGSRSADVLPVVPATDHTAGERVLSATNGMALDFWFGAMSAYDQPRNAVATIFAQALGGTSVSLHGPVVLQVGNPQTGDSLPLSGPSLVTLQAELRTIAAIPDAIEAIADAVRDFHYSRISTSD